MKKMIPLVAMLIVISLMLAACDETTVSKFSTGSENQSESVNEVGSGSEATTGEGSQANSPSDTGMTGEGQVIVVTPAIKGNSARLNVGDLLIVEIPTIPAEGWTWVPEDLDNSVLEQVGQAEYTPGTDPNDAGGIFRLQFTAVGSGTTNLTLLYVNANQADGPSLSSNSFGMEVIVN